MLENLSEAATVYVKKKSKFDPVGATNKLRGLAAKIKFTNESLAETKGFVNHQKSGDAKGSMKADRGVMSAERKVVKKQKTCYNEYRTNAMQWVESFGRSHDDRAIFFDLIRNNYYFIAPASDSDMGYIELAFGTKNEMEEINEEYERIYNAHTLSGNIDKDIQRIRDEQNNDDWDNDFPRYISEEKKDDGLSSDEIRRKADSDRTRNPSRTRENSKGIEESAAKGAMKADRATYMTARELLLQAMADEELKKSEIYSPFLREYANRVTELDKM